MLLFVAGAIVLFILSAWWLARPFSHSERANEMAAQVRQYALSRDRVLRQIEQVEAQSSEGVLIESIANEEMLRLEVELARILKHLEELEGRAISQEKTTEGRLQWMLALTVFVLVLSFGGLSLYGGWQADTFLKLAGNNDPVFAPQQETRSTQQFPPEVLAMVAQLEKRMASSPDDGIGWKRLGRSYVVMGRQGDAIDAYRKAAKLLPDDGAVREALAQLEQGRPADATRAVTTTGQSQFPPQVLEMVAQLERRLSKEPNDGAGWKRLGRAYTVMSRYSEAVSAYTSAAEFLPNDKDIQKALQQLAQIAAQAGKHPQSGQDDGEKTQGAHPPLPPGELDNIVRLEQLLGKDNENAALWAELAQAYNRIKRPEDAIRAFARAHELEQQNVATLAMYAEAVFSANPRDPDGRALVLYRKLNSLSPRHPDGLWFLGLAAYSEGNLSRSIELWNQLLKVLPVNSEGHASVRQALARVELLLNQQK